MFLYLILNAVLDNEDGRHPMKYFVTCL